MWQIILTFVSILSFVRCDTNCPNFNNYQNDPTLIDHLHGEFMVVHTTSSHILECERISWTVDSNNNRTANLKDATGCRRRIDNFDGSNPAYVKHDITPTSECSRLPGTERVSKKLLASTGVGDNFCMIVYICHPSRNGLSVVCRKPPTLSIWIAIGQLLGSLLNLLLEIPYLKTVNQYNCVFLGTRDF